MTGALQHRCWNHEAREAVCRCPGCGRPFCRECVSEHEARLLCAGCLAAASRGRTASAGRARVAAMAVVGVLLGWAIFYGGARALLLLGGK